MHVCILFRDLVFVENSSFYILNKVLFNILLPFFNTYFQWSIFISSVENKSCFYFTVIFKVDDIIYFKNHCKTETTFIFNWWYWNTTLKIIIEIKAIKKNVHFGLLYRLQCKSTEPVTSVTASLSTLRPPCGPMGFAYMAASSRIDRG